MYTLFAHAKNTNFHRTANFVLNGDNKWVDETHEPETFEELADAILALDLKATQSEADKFNAHIKVTFGVAFCNEDGITTTSNERTFSVQEAA